MPTAEDVSIDAPRQRSDLLHDFFVAVAALVERVLRVTDPTALSTKRYKESQGYKKLVFTSSDLHVFPQKHHSS